jgi:ribosomal protein S18 acetylase RimI-like enzyme
VVVHAQQASCVGCDGLITPDRSTVDEATMNVRIRPAEPEDAGAVAAVFIASAGTLTFLPRLHTDEETIEFITNTVLPEDEVLVAEVEDRVAGFVAMTSGGDLLEHLYVHPDLQGRGIGSALLEQAKARMPGGFRLWVFQSNAGARRFYERHGLRVVELTDGAANEEKTPDALYEWLPGEEGTS